MFKPLSAFIGLRYTKAKRDNNYISFISVASVFGIALGVVVLITVLSIMNGYVKGIQDRHLGMLSHITVSDSDWSLPNWNERRMQVLENKNVKAAAPFIEKQVMLKEGDKIHPTLLEAVLPEREKDIGTINRYIKQDKGLDLLEAGKFNIILGETLAKTIGVKIGESVTMLSPKQQSFAFGNDEAQNPNDLIPIIKEFHVVGTFKVDLQIYDKSLGVFDRILCDVVCSGYGVIRRKPEIRYKDPAEGVALPQTQLAILTTSARYLAPGGRLVERE